MGGQGGTECERLRAGGKMHLDFGKMAISCRYLVCWGFYMMSCLILDSGGHFFFNCKIYF